MGARGFVSFEMGRSQRIVVYTHWGGREIGEALKRSLVEVSGLKLDATLVAARLVRELVHDDPTSVRVQTSPPLDADFGGFVVDADATQVVQVSPYSGNPVAQWSRENFRRASYADFEDAWSMERT